MWEKVGGKKVGGGKVGGKKLSRTQVLAAMCEAS